MSAEPSADATRADAEALNWIVQLQEQPGDARLRQRFDAWLRASPHNAAAWRETQRVYGGMGALPPVHAARWRGLGARRTQRASARVSNGRRRWASLALAGAAAAAAVVVVGPELVVRWQADVATGTAQLRETSLADGSVATLGPGSAIKIAYSAGERRVTLLRGQAWFEVRHDAARPFRVMARDVETTDLGTAFEVRLGDDTRIAVESGSVRVEDAAQPAISEPLTAGQSLTISASGAAARREEAPDLVGAWRDGRLAVEGRPMREVIEALRPWYGGVIAVTPGVMSDRPVTGVYDLRDPAGALTALAKAYGGRVTRVTPWLLILSAG